MWGGDHPLQGPTGPHGPHRVGRTGRPHLVPQGNPVLARIPAHGYRAARGAQGQAAGEGHLFRRQPCRLGRRGQAPRGPSRTGVRVGRGAPRHRGGARPRAEPSPGGPRGRIGRDGGGGHQGGRPQGPGQGCRQGPPVHPGAVRAGARRAQPGLGRVHRPVFPPDHRRGHALARAGGSLGRVLRGWHGRRCTGPVDRSHRLRRRRGEAPVDDRSAGGSEAAECPAQAEGHQAPQDRGRIQPPRRARSPGERAQCNDPERRPGHPAGAAPDGPIGWWPLRHLRPERPVPPGHQPEQPAEAPSRPGGSRHHREQREADASGGCRRPVRQRSTGSSRDRTGQPSAQVPVRHAEGQAGQVPPEPARKARRLLGPFGHRGRPVAQVPPVRPAQGHGTRAVQAVRHEEAGRR